MTPSEENGPISPDAPSTALADPPSVSRNDEEMYFDRERWRAIGDDLKKGVEESESYLQSIGISPISLAILGIVIVLSGLGGLLAIVYLPSVGLMTANPSLPLRRSDHRVVPPQWIGYHETASFSVRIDQATCFHADRCHRLFIGSDSQVLVYNGSGRHLGSFPVSGQPQALVLSRQEQFHPGKLLVVFQDHVDLYSLSDDTAEPFSASQLTSWKSFEGKPFLTSIALTADAAYIADAGEKIIYKCNAFGQIIQKIGGSPSPTEHANNTRTAFPGFTISHPPYLSVTASSRLIHVANAGRHRVESFTTGGVWEPSLSWGDLSANFVGFCGSCNPVGIDTLSDGRIVTVEKTIDRVKVYETDGRLATVVAGPEQLDRLPADRIEQGERYLSRSQNPDASNRPLFLSVVDDRVILLDPLLQLVRIFESNIVAEPKNTP